MGLVWALWRATRGGRGGAPKVGASAGRQGSAGCQLGKVRVRLGVNSARFKVRQGSPTGCRLGKVKVRQGSPFSVDFVDFLRRNLSPYIPLPWLVGSYAAI